MKIHRHRPFQRKASQSGSTLIEVLVAALILSIGIMALIGVQGSSVQMNKLAQFRGDASRLAQDYADRVRANADNNTAAGRAALTIYASASVYTGNVAAQTVPTTCQGVATCAPTDIATMDLAEMREQARLLLPNGAFYVTPPETVGTPPNASTVLNIWVMWQTASNRGDDTGTLTGTGCPAGSVAASAKNTQCLLTRVAL